MEIPLQITARNLELSEEIKSEIHQKAEKLDKFYSRIVRCRVVVASPNLRRREGKLFKVNIDITVPGAELVVKREPDEDIRVAIRNSFSAARRKLEDYARRQRGDVKHHEETPLARVSSIFSKEGYGFITTPDDREIYFNKNSVLNHDFKRLKVGMKVRFAEEQGQEGPQASSVTVI
ncbi:MAG TPA: HPF/RaiA family ribosome-associated protein [Nitrospirae bacterium]|nr:cold shock-like protein [bacterium BMS3Abin10]GBE39829.1 cold shock-like protein [bacterium BMS3Bbin08]HDH01433.1 HPF/RaiA family ribosome-associated protein [Nitrospirota bacterium]HDH51194.1 HPF/RaiA family ribosome-associated protein [Nitrospirota bacterium]HDK81835.1 HPF/RaiA family ribosome-associated protein [Nitrospirota bacterium]